ncbi:MAG: hypothetical protein CYG60_02705 [Actinobacteria bacterium]|nr:hypothetical protein [Actinomycetota bacterium]PLS87284.1 MAG: hypothetical protein CYG60_02705 [Actinomycetota bacterium]
MADHVADFEWRGEGEEAEVAVYAPDAATAERALERTLPAARLPGIIRPVEAASSQEGFGRVTVSETHASPDLFAAPRYGLLIVAEVPVANLGTPGELPRLLARRLSEVSLPEVGESGVRELSESGAGWAAGEGFIEEDDLSFFLPGSAARTGDPDSLGRRALAAGARDWTRPGRIGIFGVGEILDSDAAGEAGLEEGVLALVVDVGAEDLGRLALAGHRERIVARTVRGDFGSPEGLPTAPADTEEAADLRSASGGAAGYAAGRAALVLYALRRSLRDLTPLRLRAAWPGGGLEGEEGGRHLHRDGLAAVGEGGIFVSGLRVAAGGGRMFGSAPPFGTSEQEGRWPWEEAGLCVGVSVLEPLGGRSEVRPWTS